MAEKKTTAKTAPAPAVETVENPVNKMIDGLVEKAQAALKEFLTLDQEQIDHIVHEMALAGLDKHQELARMAVREHPCLKVSDFEFRLPRPSYTADTLAALRQAYPDRLFTLVIGADNWLAFKDWKKPDEILSHHRILVYPRPGYAVEAASLPPGVKLTDTPLIDISSTEIRRLISQGGDASYGLDEAVWQEIRKKGYYRKA